MYKKGIFYISGILISSALFIGCTNQNEVYLSDDVFLQDINNSSTKAKNTTTVTPPIINRKISIKKEIETPLIEEQVEIEDNITIPILENNNTIAVLLSSSKIGKYALETTSAINTFLLYKNNDFNVEVYDMDKIDIEDINKTFVNSNISKIMALLPINSIDSLKKINQNENIDIYLPLINKNDVNGYKLDIKQNLIFGGINYKKQFEKLKEYANSDNLVELYGVSSIGEYLHKTLGDKSIRLNRKIDDKSSMYKNILNEFRRKNYSIILNRSIVKSSILLSQIYARGVHTKYILSTQLNYTPLLFSLTQKNDRRHFIVANSIGYIPEELIVYNNIMKENISYNWASYSTIIGLEYLINKDISLFKDISLEDNQIIYPIKLYKTNRRRFELIK